ncbi:MAG: BlaI/MecI/CopY family transcriptional regulator [Pseudomonadota bacterium]
MARRKSQTLTDGELRIMDVIWEREESTVRAVTDALNASEPVAYNTVQTMLGILADKGYVTHRKDGRAFVYSALVDRASARRSAVKHMVSRFFGGSSEALVQNLLQDDAMDALEIDRLRALLREDASADEQ